MFRFTMLVAIALLFLSVVAHPHTEAILNLSAAEGGIAFPLFSEDISLFFLSLSFLFFSSFWQECRLGLGVGADGGWG